MNLQKIKNIIFDLGGVIIHINPLLTYNAFEKLSGQPLSKTNRSLDSVQLFSNYERGTISSEEFIRRIRLEFNFINANRPDGITDQEIILAWNAILLDIPQPRHDLLLKLRSKFNTFLLSNTNEMHRIAIDQQIREKFNLKNGLKDYFNQVYTSYEMKLQKPDPEIFERVLVTQNLIPQETLFIDDTEKHLISADKLGIRTILATEENDILNIFHEYI